MVGHGLAEGGLNQAPVHLGPREINDELLFPFEAAVRDAGLRSMMPAYCDVDGVPCHASHELLTEILRDRWGFDGIVASDYVGVDELLTAHPVTGDLAEVAVMALEAGVDVELPTSRAFGEPLARALAEGRVGWAAVDLAVGRMLRAKFELGLFENPYVEPAGAALPFESDRALAAEIAPLDRPARQRRNAAATAGHRHGRSHRPKRGLGQNLLGDYSHIVHIEALLEQGGFGTEVPEDLEATDDLTSLETILQAVRGSVGPATKVRYAEGCGLDNGDDVGMRDAIKAASGADVAIVVVGERSGLTDDCLSGEARDRLEIGLPGRQGELVAAVAATGTPVVLVMVAGRPLAIEAEAALSAAVLHAWVPGEGGAGAVASYNSAIINLLQYSALCNDTPE